MPQPDSLRAEDWAAAYISDFHWVLTWLPYKSKNPSHKAWQVNGISSADKAREHWEMNPRHGIGIILEPSNIVTIDVDHVPYCEKLLETFDLSLEELTKDTIVWTGRPERLKFAFRIPDSLQLTRHPLSWPELDIPTGELVYKPDPRTSEPRLSKINLIDFRGGNVQDLLPPSLHPDIEKPYRWIQSPWEYEIQPLPDKLLTIWQDWKNWQPRLEALCPWGDPIPANVSLKAPPKTSGGNASDIVARYNDAHTVDDVLQSNGYLRKSASRYLHPDSTTGSPGVFLRKREGVPVCFSHHGSCALNDGNPHDAFDCFRMLHHNGDWKSALKAAADDLGIKLEPAKFSAKATVHDIVTGQQRQAEADWTDQLIENQRGGLKSNLSNLELILANDPAWKGVLGYNQFENQIYKLKPPPYENGEIGMWTDYDDAKTSIWLSRSIYKLDIELRRINETILVVAKDNSFHPVREYLNTLFWDGAERADTWLSVYLGAEDNEYHQLIGRKWLHAAVARIYDPGCKFDQILILEGNQRIGKSTVFSVLGGKWYSDGHIDLRNIRDAALTLENYWIIEIAELLALFSAHEDTAKAFFSKQHDDLRRPWGRNVERLKRQCVIVATGNRDNYLKDDTGNERYWPVLCGKIDLQKLRQDKDQLWAEAVQIYLQKKRNFLVKSNA